MFFSLAKLADRVLFIEDADFVMSGTDNYMWFGTDAFCTKNTFVVGVPGRRPNKETQSAGAVYGYSIADKSLKFALNSNED